MNLNKGLRRGRGFGNPTALRNPHYPVHHPPLPQSKEGLYAIMLNHISGQTTLFGLLGHPVAHSISPKMHNLSFQLKEIDGVYLAFNITPNQLKEAITAIRTFGIRGVNVTMPHKSTVIPYLDHLTPVARLAGSVNTILNDHGVLIGHSTDGIGYVSALLQHGIALTGKKITIVGAGGTAMSICAQLALDNEIHIKEISLFNRQSPSFPLAEQFAKKLRLDTHCNIHVFDLADRALLKTHIQQSTIFSNCTNVGMGQQKNQSIIEDASMLPRDLFVTDTIYHPTETKLLTIAKQAGCRTMNGLDMLLYQGAASFEYWTGSTMPTSFIKKTLFTG